MDGIPADAPDFVQRVTRILLAGDGDLLPVSALPADGTFPTGTARYEKRAIAKEIPIWDPDICIDCGKCAVVCPHATIRMKVFTPDAVADAPADFLHKDFRSKDLPGHRLTIQVAPDDCTGCGVCVDVCPAKSKTEVRHKAINMEPAAAHRDIERGRWDYFQSIAPLDRELLPHDSVKGAQVLEPLFEFSGACAGCGETPYLKLVTQLFGDRMVVANATGCSSIYGANLPTTPWTTNAEGRGPAWSNSLFEDNAEFGLGMRLAVDAQERHARDLLAKIGPAFDAELTKAILGADQDDEAGVVRQARPRRAPPLAARASRQGRRRRGERATPAACSPSRGISSSRASGSSAATAGRTTSGSAASTMCCRVAATSTCSSSTPRCIRTPAARRRSRRLGARWRSSPPAARRPPRRTWVRSRAYGNVYVAQISMGANELQSTKALLEADAWPGPSLVIAYSTCIAHGIDMSKSMSHQKDAVKSGYWPLYRFQPSETDHGQPFKLDSHRPSIPVRDFAADETRFAILERTHPEQAGRLAALAQADADERWRYYEQLAGMHRTVPHEPLDGEGPA